MLDSCHLWQEREITCTMSNSDTTYKNDWSSEFGTTCVWIIETYLAIDGCVSSLQEKLKRILESAQNYPLNLRWTRLS